MVFISSEGRSWVYRVPLCFMGPGGLHLLSARLVLPYRERVRESSDRPHSCKSNLNEPYSCALTITHYWQYRWFTLSAFCLLDLCHQMCDIIKWLCLTDNSRDEALTDKMHWALTYRIYVCGWLTFPCLIEQLCLHLQTVRLLSLFGAGGKGLIRAL